MDRAVQGYKETQARGDSMTAINRAKAMAKQTIVKLRAVAESL